MEMHVCFPERGHRFWRPFRKNPAGLQRLFVNAVMDGRNKALKQGMGLMRLAQEFRMKLAGDEKRMIRQLNYFNQFSVRREAAENKSGFFETFAVDIIEFIAVAMTFVNDE